MNDLWIRECDDPPGNLANTLRRALGEYYTDEAQVEWDRDVQLGFVPDAIRPSLVYAYGVSAMRDDGPNGYRQGETWIYGHEKRWIKITCWDHNEP